jgi:hypothetical protein
MFFSTVGSRDSLRFNTHIPTFFLLLLVQMIQPRITKAVKGTAAAK